MFLAQLQEEKKQGWACYLHSTKDQVDGMVSVDHRTGRIEHLFVTQAARGKGLGCKMLDFARKKLPEHPHPVLSVLDSNTRAMALYRRMGWQCSGVVEERLLPGQVPGLLRACSVVQMRYEGTAEEV